MSEARREESNATDREGVRPGGEETDMTKLLIAAILLCSTAAYADDVEVLTTFVDHLEHQIAAGDLRPPLDQCLANLPGAREPGLDRTGIRQVAIALSGARRGGSQGGRWPRGDVRRRRQAGPPRRREAADPRRRAERLNAAETSKEDYAAYEEGIQRAVAAVPDALRVTMGSSR